MLDSALNDRGGAARRPRQVTDWPCYARRIHRAAHASNYWICRSIRRSCHGRSFPGDQQALAPPVPGYRSRLRPCTLCRGSGTTDWPPERHLRSTTAVPDSVTPAVHESRRPQAARPAPIPCNTSLPIRRHHLRPSIDTHAGRDTVSSTRAPHHRTRSCCRSSDIPAQHLLRPGFDGSPDCGLLLNSYTLPEVRHSLVAAAAPALHRRSGPPAKTISPCNRHRAYLARRHNQVLVPLGLRALGSDMLVASHRDLRRRPMRARPIRSAAPTGSSAAWRCRGSSALRPDIVHAQ